MSDENQSIAQMVKDGSYFREARQWFEAVYVAPIAERGFFLIISMLAILVALVSIFALGGLMPIHERPGVVIATDRPFDLHPRLSKVRPRGDTVEPAMEQQLLRLYVSAREGYEVSRYNSNYAYVLAHSDEPTGQAYTQLYSSANPQSLAALLGYSGQRVVSVDNITISDSGTSRTARVSYTTELINVPSGNAKTRWTAELQYHYTPLTVTEGKDASGHPTLTTQDPQLQVVGYAVTQTP